MANKPKWGEETFRRVYEMDKAIRLPDNRENYRDIYDGMTYEQTWEYSPAAKLDERFPFPLQIAGSEFEIRLQASFGKWLHDVLGRRLGYLVRFEDFWEQWSEKGFSWTINRTGTSNVSTNYPLRDTQKPDGTEVKGWRVDRDTRPAYLEWKNPKPSANPYYRIIEYWPNRSDTNTSYVLVGSDSEVIRHIVAIEYSGGGGDISDDMGRGVPESKFLEGFPTLHFHFREKYPPLGKHKLISRFTVSLVGWVESETLKTWDYDKIITKEFLKNLAKNIEKNFIISDNPWELERGSLIFSYQDWKNGLALWSPLKNQSIAEILFGKIADCVGKPYNKNKLNIKNSAYPQTSQSFQVPSLDMSIEREAKHREGKLRFFKSFLILPKSRKKVTLSSFSAKDPVDDLVKENED